MFYICEQSDIDFDQAKEFSVDDKAVFVVNKDGVYTAFFNWCPHLGIELNFRPDVFLCSENHFIQCANHGALFDTEGGLCLSGPCSGMRLVQIPLTIENGKLYAPEVPDWPS